MRGLSRNPSQNLAFSLWRLVIAAAGGLGAGVPLHKGALIGFKACNLTSAYAVVVLMVVKFCKGRVTAAPEPRNVTVDWKCDLLRQIEQLVFRGNIKPEPRPALGSSMRGR